MVKYHAPRRGSLAFRRKRARRIYPNIRSWPKVDKIGLLGFPAYKVGMVSVRERNLLVSEKAMWYNLERVVGATVLEAPPIRVMGLRFYTITPYGLKSLTEIWTPYLTDFERKILKKKFTITKKSVSDLKELFEKRKSLVESYLDASKVHEIRAIVRTSPHMTGIGKKKPELMEIKIGGMPKDAYTWGLENIGKLIRVQDVFEQGMFVDIIGITKGKGFAGVVKRFGVTLLPPKSKKGRRRIGTLGPWTPGRIMWTVPRPGQLGFFRRTEFNKQIMAILPAFYDIQYNFDSNEGPFIQINSLDSIAVEDEDLIKSLVTIKGEKEKERKKILFKSIIPKMNPAGGWPHYGIIKNDIIIIRGSVMGPPKRMVFLRFPIRPKALKKDVDLIEIYYGREKLLDAPLISDTLKVIKSIA